MKAHDVAIAINNGHTVNVTQAGGVRRQPVEPLIYDFDDGSSLVRTGDVFIAHGPIEPPSWIGAPPETDR